MSLKIIHDLSKLSVEEEAAYLREVSVFIGLDPDLNGLDTIFMPNENGPGQSKVVYARRGTAEILREKHGIDVSTLTHVITPESAVFTAIGKNKAGRQEIAIGSKSLRGLNGRAYDNAVMTASTRALRRLTMQFTKLGILDESEIEGMRAETLINPAANAQLAGSPVVIPPSPTAPVNNAPGRDVTPIEKIGPSQDPKTQAQVAAIIAIRDLKPKNFADNQKEMIEEALVQHRPADKVVDIPQPVAPVTPTPAPVTSEPEEDKKADKPKRGRRSSKNTVSISDPEPEVVNVSTPPAITLPASIPAPISVPPSVTPEPQPQTPAPTPAPSLSFGGQPTVEQMADYRKRVSVYTSQLPSSENLGSVQKMRAFITKMSGTAPQSMTTDQWEDMLGWFEHFVATNQVKGLVKYINDSLGVK